MIGQLNNQYKKNSEVTIHQSAKACIKDVDTIFIAYKPYHVEASSEEIAEVLSPDQTLISMLSGTSIEVLEKAFPKSDRITMYRTLKTFEEKGILHSIKGEGDEAKYALCNDRQIFS